MRKLWEKFKSIFSIFINNCADMVPEKIAIIPHTSCGLSSARVVQAVASSFH